ncbi:50S ribosomal protein L37ae [Candidatus Pacearchaeota archaeon]|nr:50S ribosomal protein L37ae [Candidatus Pacearchaeota archaeon]
MSKRNKVGSAGRFRAGYGRKVREKVWKVEKIQKQKQLCRCCGKPKAKRLSKGLWECKACNKKFTSHAYHT